MARKTSPERGKGQEKEKQIKATVAGARPRMGTRHVVLGTVIRY